MANENGNGGLLDLLAGVSKGLSTQIGRKARELQEELARVPTEPQKTGATEGSKWEEMLSHLYRLSFGANTIGDVIDCFDYTGADGETIRMARISASRRILEAIQPKGIELKSGMAVRLNQHNQIVGLADTQLVGPSAKVLEVLTDGFVTVEIANTTRSVRSGKATGLTRGDRVVLDEMQLVIVGTLPKDSDEFSYKREPANSLDDIIGQEEAVLVVKEAVDFDPVKDAVARHYNRKPCKGALVYGPPGCGKTMLSEGAAHRMAERHGKKALESGYIYVNSPDFLDKFVGETESAIRECFEAADRHFKEHGYRAVLAFDECEAILSRRGSGKSSDMEKSTVTTFLGLMNFTTAFVMLMTNRADTLDPAIIRDKRIDRQIYVGRPTRAAGERIIAMNLAKYPTVSSVEVLARVAADAFYDPAKHLIDESLPLRDGVVAHFTLAHIVNGGMLTRYVEDAVGVAEARDRASGLLTGVTEADIITAADKLFEQKRKLKHDDELQEFFVSLKDKLPDGEQRQAMSR